MNYFYNSVLFIIIFTSWFPLSAQENNSLTDADKHALESIIVEKYYTAGSSNTDLSGLPPNAVTYRIYIDMKPGYVLQTIYGAPGHPLRISTTTRFFNTKDQGVKTGNELDAAQLNNAKVLFDSWLTMNDVSKGYAGILKADDKDGSIIKNKAFDKADGLIKIEQPADIAVYGFDLNFFNDTEKASSFYSEDGLLAVFMGVKGPTEDNRVLIAQLTTDGKLSFEFNFQIISPAKEVLQFVAKDPENAEIQYSEPAFY